MPPLRPRSPSEESRPLTPERAAFTQREEGSQQLPPFPRPSATRTFGFSHDRLVPSRRLPQGPQDRPGRKAARRCRGPPAFPKLGGLWGALAAASPHLQALCYPSTWQPLPCTGPSPFPACDPSLLTPRPHAVPSHPRR